MQSACGSEKGTRYPFLTAFISSVICANNNHCLNISNMFGVAADRTETADNGPVTRLGYIKPLTYISIYS